ncbi:MAG: winged helix-turn-helix transcriptional regulator [Alphaproteobacteria bacterium]|nr:winged helix-turn-helix transcriptional regulator [Alphaproteobacteria bacterium]
MPADTSATCDSASLELERFLPYRLSVLTNTISTAIARLYSRRFQLSIPEWRVMAALGRYPGLSANEIAERTAMDKVQVSRAVSRLMSQGRIARLRDGNDGRVRRLSLTAQGESVYAEIAPLALSIEARLLRALDPAMNRQLDAIIAILQAEAERLHVAP